MITIPTIKELYDSIINDLETSFGNNIPLFGKNFLRAMAGVQAAKLKIYYLAIGNLQKNIFVDTADPESVGGTLERFGRVKLNRNPFPATSGQYTIEVTGTIGSFIPALTVWKSDDDATNPGKLFILDTNFELESSPDTLTVRALETGVASKLFIGETLTVTGPIAGVNESAEVASETIEPRSAESIEEYRQKTVESYRTEPQGGAPSDYRIWAADAQGVKTVYPYATPGQTAEVDLYVEAFPDDSTDGKGTPSLALLDDVEAVVEVDPDKTKSINERGRRPMGVFQVNYIAVSVLDVEIQITGLVNSTAAKQAFILSSLTQLINSIRPFIAGIDVLSTRNDSLNQNNVIAAILSAVPGVQFDSVEITIDGNVETSYEFTDGEIPYLDSLTYV